MKKTKQILGSALLVFILLFAQGCATIMGNDSLRTETEESVGQKITEGKTTKSEVKEMFGSPISTSYTDGGLEIWKYELSKMKRDAIWFVPVVGIFAANSSGMKKELTVLFNDQDKVQKYNMSESPIEVRRGLFNQ